MASDHAEYTTSSVAAPDYTRRSFWRYIFPDVCKSEEQDSRPGRDRSTERRSHHVQAPAPAHTTKASGVVEVANSRDTGVRNTIGNAQAGPRQCREIGEAERVHGKERMCGPREELLATR